MQCLHNSMSAKFHQNLFRHCVKALIDDVFKISRICYLQYLELIQWLSEDPQKSTEHFTILRLILKRC